MRTGLAAVLILLGLSAGASRAQTGPEKVRFVYSAIGGSQASVWIPYEAGIFRKHGLEIELLYVGGGGRAAQVVQSGEAPLGIFTGGAVVNSNLAGGDLVVVASSLNVITFSLMVRPEISRLEDLKGRRIGITRFGSATDFALQYSEGKWPLRRGKDFAVLQMGGMPELLAGLKGGALEGATLNPEFTILARRDGFKELVDMSAMGLQFPTSAIGTTRSFIRRSENTVRKFVRGFAEGSHFAKSQRAFSVEVFRKYLRNPDRAYLNSVYDLYVLRYIPKIPYPSADSIRTVLSQMADNPRAAAAQPEQFIDARFFQEMERDGFLERLWR